METAGGTASPQAPQGLRKIENRHLAKLTAPPRPSNVYLSTATTNQGDNVSDAYTPIFEASREAFETLAAQYNEKVSAIKAASGSEQDQLNEILKNSQDPNVAEYRRVKEELENNLAEILEQITAYAKDPAHKLMVTSNVNVEEETKAAKELKNQHQKLFNGLKALPAGDAFDKFAESLTKLESFRATGGNETGQQRWRLSSIEIKPATADDNEYKSVKDTKKNDDGTYSDVVTFSVLSRELSKAAGSKVDVASIYTHATEARKEVKEGETFTFAMSIPNANGENSANFMIRVTPKA